MNLSFIPILTDKKNTTNWRKFLILGKIPQHSSSLSCIKSIQEVASFLSGNIISEKYFTVLDIYLKECVSSINEMCLGRTRLVMEPYHTEQTCGIFRIKAYYDNRGKTVCEICLCEPKSTMKFTKSTDEKTFGIDGNHKSLRFSYRW